MSSQYSLALKATLDTSQVQQELQKLRTAQNGASGSSAGSSNGGSVNFGIIDKTLIKLN